VGYFRAERGNTPHKRIVGTLLPSILSVSKGRQKVLSLR
jgi:hypothetical protein